MHKRSLMYSQELLLCIHSKCILILSCDIITLSYHHILLLYFIKSLFLVLLTHKQNRFLNNMMAYIANNLFSSYLTKPYSFHLNRNASELIKNIQVEINFLGVFFLSFITIFIEGGFVVSVLATLVYIEPVGAISIGLFYGLLSMIFLQFTKRKLSMWGKLRQELDTQTSKIALEGLGGIKDLLILGRTSFFIDEYLKKIILFPFTNFKYEMKGILPKTIKILAMISIFEFLKKPIESLCVEKPPVAIVVIA